MNHAKRWTIFLNNTKSNFFRFINVFCNLYYTKLKRKPLVDGVVRYKLQQYLDSEDFECQLLGASLLTNYNSGNDLLRDCLYRMTDSCYYEIKKYPERVKWYKIGDIQLNYNTRIQEFIDEIDKTLSSETNPCLLHKRIAQYLQPIGYWMYYHPRIGSNNAGYTGIIRCPNPKHKNEKIEIVGDNFFSTVYTWDWLHQHWSWPIDAKIYWKHHKKPNLTNI